MSNLRPTGYPIELDGVERNFLFTLNVIDEVQSEFDCTTIEVLDKIFNGTEKEQVEYIRMLVMILINDEIQRKHKEEKEITLQEAGWLVSIQNISQVKSVIGRAYGLSMPEEETPNPNQKSEQQKN